MRRDVLLCTTAFLIACLLVYGRALVGFFLADDYTIIASFWNKGPRYLLGLLASDEIGGVWAEQFVRPLRPWSLALDGRIWGLDPLGFHLTNVLLHAVTSILIAVLALQLGARFLQAFVASLFFLLHPLNVEVAAWVTGRDESLSCAALLAAVVCHFQAAANGRRRLWLSLSIASFAVSLLSKEYALLLPPALWAFSFVRCSVGESRLRALRNSITASLPMLGIIALFLVLRFLVSGNPLGGYGTGAAAHASIRPDLLIDSIASFAGDLFEPFAERPYVALAFVLAFLTLLARARVRSPALVVFWALLWPTLFLMPTHNLVYSPRHLYISFAGMTVAFGLVLVEARDKRESALSLAFGGSLALLLAPPTLAAVSEFTRMGNRCRMALSSVELASRSMAPADVLVLVGMPAHKRPPWGFGWSLEDALRPPFLAEALDSRLQLDYRRQWRPGAWAFYRRKYPARRIHVLSWNPAFNGIEILRDGSPPERPP